LYGKPEKRQPQSPGSRVAEHRNGQEHAGTDRAYDRRHPVQGELLLQRNLYHQLNQEAHTAMEACGGTAQGQSAMAKFNTKMGISMKTLTDKSTRNLAEMLTQGSG